MFKFLNNAEEVLSIINEAKNKGEEEINFYSKVNIVDLMNENKNHFLFLFFQNFNFENDFLPYIESLDKSLDKEKEVNITLTYDFESLTAIVSLKIIEDEIYKGFIDVEDTNDTDFSLFLEKINKIHPWSYWKY